jgi:hypothetical protein
MMIETYIERLKAIDAVNKLASLASKLYDYREITDAYMQYLNALLNSQQQEEDHITLLEQELDEARELYTEIFQSIKDVEQIRALISNIIEEYNKQKVIQEEL